MSALSRVAVDNHKHISVEQGDTVVLSSRIIPGNEKAIFRMIDHMSRRGADVLYGSMNPPLHVSGHASVEEMKLVLNLVRPRYFMPIHGEYRQLSKHARLAEHLRFAGLEETFIMESGDVLEIDHHGARKSGQGAGGPRLHRFRLGGRSGAGGGDSRPPPSFRGRHRAAHHRHQPPDRPHGEPAGDCQPRLRAGGKTAPSSCEKARQVVAKTLEGSNQEEKTDWGVMKEKIRADLKRYIVKETRAAAADHAGDSGSVSPHATWRTLPGSAASAERVIVPADEGGRGGRVARSFRGRRSGDDGGRRHGRHRRTAFPWAAGCSRWRSSTAWRSIRGMPSPAPGAAARCACRGTALAASSIRPTPPRTAACHRRHDCHQCQRVAQLPLRRHAPLGRGAARGAGRRPRHRESRAATPSISTRAPSRCPQVTKNTAGYPLRPGMDWVDLFVGSEGTLGVVTEARVRLLPAPKAVLAGVVFFADDGAGAGRRGRLARNWRPHAGISWTARRSTCCARAFRKSRPRREAAILFDQELASRRRSRRSTAGWSAFEARGAFEEESSGSRFRPPTASASADSATRCRNWSTIPCGAAGALKMNTRLRRAAGAQSRDAGVLPASVWSTSFPGGT